MKTHVKLERKNLPAEIKQLDDQGIVEAIVSVTNNLDLGGEVVMPGFFQKSLQAKLPKGVWGHDWRQPVAKTLAAEELGAGDERLPEKSREFGGYYIKGQFNLETQRGREAFSDIKFGIIDEFSIGYFVNKDEVEEGKRKLIEGEWYEWSPVLVGMNPATSVISVKDAEPDPPQPSEKLVSDLQEFAEQMQKFQEIRAKEGRVISAANRKKIQAVLDSLVGIESVKQGLSDLLAMSEPKQMADPDEARTLHAQILEQSIRFGGTTCQ